MGTMIAAKLSSIGIPEKVINIWENSGLKSLTRIQQIALNSKGLFRDNLLILAPTSSGKTFCGELAIIKAAVSGKKGIFLVPLKAIAVEKADEFKDKYEKLGVRIAISTRDDRDDDQLIVKGDFDIAIIIYEKFNRFLTANINLLSSVSVIIFDEVDIIYDVSRGETVRLILAKASLSKSKTQVIGLGREDFNVDRMSLLSNYKVIRDNYRPIELRKGIFYGGSFDYRNHNALIVDSEQFPVLEDEDYESGLNPALRSTIEHLCSSNEQIIIFLKSKPSVVNGALELSAANEFFKAHKTIKRISDLERTSNLKSLLVCLESGVGFHNSDLTEFESRAVIEGFRNGDIRILFSTTTLSSGINLPAKNVIIEPMKYSGENNNTRPMEIPMEFTEVDTISGRAGRLGMGDEFGRAILIARNEFDREVLWSRFVDGYPEDNERFISVITEEAIVDLISTGQCETTGKLKLAMAQIGMNIEIDWSDKLLHLIDEGLIKYENERIVSTSLGKACALTGLKVKTVAAASKIAISGNPPDSIENWIGFLSYTSEAGEIKMPVSFYYRCSNYQTGSNIQNEDFDPKSITDLKSEYFKVLISDWIEGTDITTLEEKYSITAGMIENIAQRFGWLLYSCCEIFKAVNINELTETLRKQADIVKYGLPYEGLKFAKLKIFGLGRLRIIDLINAGFSNASDICGSKIEKLPPSIPESIRELIYKTCKKNSKTRRRINKMLTSTENETGIKNLKIGSDNGKGRIRISINGYHGMLTYKSYLYLKRLADALVTNENEGWLHRLDLEDGDNQWSYLHRLRRELKSLIPDDVEVIENNRNGFYRLNAIPEGITVSMN
ncbi:MAG: DEAD/DEAH box helicase [candidate division Zixibacteria bacterium]|nr:DEAD/DEAH box helicase [candidate division Zixibacteria bacterium]